MGVNVGSDIEDTGGIIVVFGEVAGRQARAEDDTFVRRCWRRRTSERARPLGSGGIAVAAEIRYGRRFWLEGRSSRSNAMRIVRLLDGVGVVVIRLTEVDQVIRIRLDDRLRRFWLDDRGSRANAMRVVRVFDGVGVVVVRLTEVDQVIRVRLDDRLRRFWLDGRGMRANAVSFESIGELENGVLDRWVDDGSLFRQCWRRCTLE